MYMYVHVYVNYTYSVSSLCVNVHASIIIVLDKFMLVVVHLVQTAHVSSLSES